MSFTNLKLTALSLLLPPQRSIHKCALILTINWHYIHHLLTCTSLFRK